MLLAEVQIQSSSSSVFSVARFINTPDTLTQNPGTNSEHRTRQLVHRVQQFAIVG